MYFLAYEELLMESTQVSHRKWLCMSQMAKCHVVLRHNFSPPTQNHQNYSVVLQESSGIPRNSFSPTGICGGLRSTGCHPSLTFSPAKALQYILQETLTLKCCKLSKLFTNEAFLLPKVDWLLSTSSNGDTQSEGHGECYNVKDRSKEAVQSTQ